jgi:hypothetical protein
MHSLLLRAPAITPATAMRSHALVPARHAPAAMHQLVLCACCNAPDPAMHSVQCTRCCHALTAAMHSVQCTRCCDALAAMRSLLPCTRCRALAPGIRSKGARIPSWVRSSSSTSRLPLMIFMKASTCAGGSAVCSAVACRAQWLGEGPHAPASAPGISCRRLCRRRAVAVGERRSSPRGRRRRSRQIDGRGSMLRCV